MKPNDVQPQWIDEIHQLLCRKVGKEPLSPEILKIEVVPRFQFMHRTKEVSLHCGQRMEEFQKKAVQESSAIVVANKDASMFYILLSPDEYPDLNSLALPFLGELAHVYLGHFEKLPFECPEDDFDFAAGRRYYQQFQAECLAYEAYGDIVGKPTFRQPKGFIQTIVDAVAQNANPYSPPFYYDAERYAALNAAIIKSQDFDIDKVRFPEPTIRKSVPMKAAFKNLLVESMPMTRPDYEPTPEGLLHYGKLLIGILLRFINS